MDKGKRPSNLKNPRNPPRIRSASTSSLIENHAARELHANGRGVSAQDAASLAPSASVAGNLDQTCSSMLPPGYYPSTGPLPGFYGNFLHHDNMPPPQSVPPTSVSFPWHIQVRPPTGSKSSTNQHNVSQASSSTSLVHPGPLALLDSRRGSLHPSDATTDNPQQARVSAVASHNSSPPEVELTEAERAAASDEKRRRNTAASARFRIKKKHRTIALERTVSDLTGRAEELEREVCDLRRENQWLKEIVMLKGTQNIANNRLALRQAVALATSQRTYGSELQRDVSEGSSSGQVSDDETPLKKPTEGTESKRS